MEANGPTRAALGEPRKPTRELTGHVVNPANDRIKIHVLDEPGDGGACHVYGITWSWEHPDGRMGQAGGVTLSFQNGPIAEAGVNGITHEVLLAILVDRLEGFQAGPFACRENAIALTKVQEAQLWLQKRTRDRMGRGVEGTHEV